MDLKNKKKIKDLVFKGGIVLVFVVVFYFALFASSENEPIQQVTLNSELPDAKAVQLMDKVKAYENELLYDEDRKRMKNLDDYMFDLKTRKESGKAEGNALLGNFNMELKDVPEKEEGLEALKNALSSTGDNAYDELSAEYNKLQAENERMRSELNRQKRQEERLAIMEKGYEMVSKQNKETPADIVSPEREEVVDVMKKENEVVSTLSEEILENAPYNYGFITAVGSGYETGSNTIRAAISETQTVTAGSIVKLKLLEPLQAGSITIPRNHIVAGVTAISGNQRMDIRIESIEFAGNIIPVNMKVYDTDGIAGIHCPGSAELDALKEGAANIGAGLGTSISFARDAGQQIAMDLTRGIMSGGSQYLSKKLRTVKVTLKSNYEVLLLPQKR